MLYAGDILVSIMAVNKFCPYDNAVIKLNNATLITQHAVYWQITDD